MQKCLFRGITTLPPSIRLEVPRPLRSRGCPLQRLFSTFPNGFPGGGLLLLRLVIALNAAAEGIFILSSPDHETASGWCLGGLGGCDGQLDPDGISCGRPIRRGLAAVGNVIMNLVRLPSSQASALASPIAHLNLAIICVALVLLGPGRIFTGCASFSAVAKSSFPALSEISCNHVRQSISNDEEGTVRPRASQRACNASVEALQKNSTWPSQNASTAGCKWSGLRILFPTKGE